MCHFLFLILLSNYIAVNLAADHSNGTGLRAIGAFVIKFTTVSFIISCFWPIKLKMESMESPDRQGME